MPTVNYKNSNYKYLSNEIVSAPLSSVGTGTVSSDDKALIGVGTLFTTEIPKGSWVIDFANNELRQVDRVESDTLAYLTEAFSTDLAALSQLDKIHSMDCNAVSISVQVLSSAAADITIDGEIFPKGASITFSKDSRDRSGKRDLVDPIIIDATGSTAMLLIME